MNIAVVGFGLVGRIAALMLSQKHQVEVFEKQTPDAPDSAGAVAAAMLAPLAESVVCDSDLAELGIESLAMWPALLSLLDEDVFFQRNGTLVIAHPADKGDLLSFRRRLKPLTGYNAVELMSADIAALEPELGGRFHCGLYLEGEGQLDNRAFFQASLQTLKRRGVVFHSERDAVIHGERVNGRPFDRVVDCRGLGASADVKELRGVRGEVARVYAPEVTLTRPVRLMHPRYPIYIVPKPGDEFVIGATEIESRDGGAVTVRSALELLSAAYSVHSGFAEGRVLSLKTGLRPALSDNRPKVEKQGRQIRINGLYRHGYMVAPAVVKNALADLL